MKIASASSNNIDEIQAAGEAYKLLMEKLQDTPHLILVHSSCLYDNKALLKQLKTLAPEATLHGGTSCLGVMTESGFHSQSGKGLGLLGICDPEGSFGAGIADIDKDPEAATKIALEQALIQSGRPGEVPDAVIISSCAGYEEKIIHAIEKYIGLGVPIIGGTSADNDMSGKWQQFADNTVKKQAVSIATLFTSGEIGYGFHCGYEPTAFRGKVTRAKDRVLYEIDNQPAAEVYNRWTNGLITEVLPQGGSLVPLVSLSPVGRPVGQVGNISYFILSYPVEVIDDQALLLFTEINENEEIVLMKGTDTNIASRAGRVATLALDSAPFDAEEIQGAFVLFCTGCMLIVKDRLSEVIEGLQSSLNKAPFLGAFTLGEQGCFIGGENRHGNLMIAVLVFGPKKMGI